MDHVLTLVAETADVARTAASAVEHALDERGIAHSSRSPRSSGRALDLFFALPADQATDAIETVARNALGQAPVDLLAQTVAERPRRLFVADLESTIIANEMLDDMADTVGVGDRVSAITARAMRGELDFESSLRERLALFADQPATLLDRVAGGIRFNPGAEALVSGLRSAGITTVLVTGGFHVFADGIARRLGFDRVFANRFEIVDGRLTGRPVPPILDRDAKRSTLLTLCGELDITPDQAIAIGDGANDLAMLGVAGLGIAYRAKPAVREAARGRIDHTGLDTVLDYLGLDERGLDDPGEG